MTIPCNSPEISDRVVDFDRETLERLHKLKSEDFSAGLSPAASNPCRRNN
jgi:hypothetical protein